MTSEQDNSAYPKAYGRSGFMRPNFALCCEVVRHGAWDSKQCTRPRGHGPGLAYCKQHDPEAVRAKADAKRAKAESEWAAKQKAWDMPKAFKAALEAIANGHNDPRALAAETLAKWD